MVKRFFSKISSKLFKKSRDNYSVENMCKLKENGMYKVVTGFARANVFYISIEMLLTFYIVEMAVLLTTYFSKNGSVIPLTPFTIFLPLILAIPITLLSLLGALLYSQKTAVNYIKDYAESKEYKEGEYNFKQDPEDKSDKRITFEKFLKNHRKKTRIAHIICVVIYLVFSLVIGWFVNDQTHLFNRKFIVCFSGIAVLFGSLWNLDAYYRHQRVLWSKVFKKMSKDDKIKDVENYCGAYKKSIVTIIASIVLLLFLFAIVLYYFHSKDKRIKDLLDDGYATLILPFFSLIIVYIKQIYSLSFKNNVKEVFCPSLESVLSEFEGINSQEQNKTPGAGKS